jgi:hypothetical protein
MKLHPSITHISSDKPLSEESVASINKIASLVYKLTDQEIKEINRLVQIKQNKEECDHKTTHMRGGIIRCSKCKKPFY